MAASVYRGLTLGLGPSLFTDPQGVVALPLTAATLYLGNTVITAGAASINLRRNPVKLWWEGGRKDILQEASLFIFGFIGALSVYQAPWTILLLVIPVAVIHHTFKQALVLRERLQAQMEQFKVTQAQLIQSAKMATVGTLVAGIAHQINNPLFAILGRAELLLGRREYRLSFPKIRHHLEVIHDMATRISKVAQCLLHYLPGQRWGGGGQHPSGPGQRPYPGPA